MVRELVGLSTCFFFFSRRRRHTRCLSDWSSDVCSSDLSARAFSEAARRMAIGTAIEKARADADAAAKAAHGTLGTLLEINIGSYSPPPPRPMMMMTRKDAAQADTPITPGEETLAVEVSTRWRILPGQ